MIPKIIHFCWLSDNPYPQKVKYCIDSWERTLSGYQIMHWTLKSFEGQLPRWVQEAYENKKYAFAADYIRCYALYHYGGIYLDSDVEVLRPYDDLLHLPYFIGKEQATGFIEAATMGAEKGLPLFRYLLDYYDARHFAQKGHLDTRAMPRVMQEVLEQHYQFASINSPAEMTDSEQMLYLLPADYFSPLRDEHLYVTSNTYSIHHYAGSWHAPLYNHLRRIVIRLFGVRFKQWVGKVLRVLFNKAQ